jgi:hypothetical protein
MRILSVTWGALRHASGAAAEAALVLAIAVALVFGAAVVTSHDPAGAGAVFAARGGNGGGGTEPSIALVQVNGFAASVQPSLRSTVTFTVSVPKNINNPRVELMCYQAGSVVYGETGSVAQATADGTDPLGYSGFLLGGGGSIWLTVGGPADCTASLFYFGQHAGVQTFNALASTSFSAGG